MVGQSIEVITSLNYEEHLTEILEYGIEMFGYLQARKYFHAVSHLVERLDVEYTYHPECRHLATKSRMYRNIILDAHLIIYRITNRRIEVLDIVHSASSIRKIRSSRNIRFE
jgi:plasmid stabilization system protein ParE